MTERYPFFREEDEQTLAVIGEEAVASDLNGTYQKPYTVLTQKRLYCKNEAGNFITEAGALRSARKGLLPGQNWFLWAVVLCLTAVVALFFLLCNPWSGDMKWVTEESQRTITYYTGMKEEAEQCEKDIKDAEKTYHALEQQLEDKRAEWISAGYDELYAQADEIEGRLASLRQFGDNFSYIQSLKEKLDWLLTSEECYEYYGLSLSRYNPTEEQYESLRQRRAEALGVALEDIPTWQSTLSTEELNVFLDVAFGSCEWLFEGEKWWWYWRPEEVFQGIVSVYSGEYYYDGAYLSFPFQPYAEYLYYNYWGANDDYFIIFSLLSRSCENYLNSADDLPMDEASLQAMLDDLAPQMEESAGLHSEINGLENQLSGGPEAVKGQSESRLARLKQDIERTEESYKQAKALTGAIGRAKLLLIVLVVGLMLVAVLTALRRTKLAAVVTWISVAVGLLMRSSLRTILPWYENWPFTVTMVVLLAALALSVAALVYHRFRTVYQIAHTTGIFNFTPSQYPASEFKSFTAQVEGLKAGDTAHA